MRKKCVYFLIIKSLNKHLNLFINQRTFQKKMIILLYCLIEYFVSKFHSSSSLLFSYKGRPGPNIWDVPKRSGHTFGPGMSCLKHYFIIYKLYSSLIYKNNLKILN